jgi:hypothetical protein
MNNHFFDFYGEDAITVGLSGRDMDLEPYGAPAGCCFVLDYVVQQITPEDTVSFEWNTKDHLDFTGVPDSFFTRAKETFEYAHINSWSYDPGDGTWILSNLWTSQVLRVAPAPMTWHGASYAAGDILERVGGTALSDYTFVDDDRGNGVVGFVGQHSARVVAPDHLAVYDNGYSLGGDAVGDSRAVEYALDREAGTATRVWDYTGEGTGWTALGGSVERLPDGSTLIGWAAAAATGPWGPALSEIGPDGEVVFTLTLEGTTGSYRVSKAVRVDGRWTAAAQR